LFISELKTMKTEHFN